MTGLALSAIPNPLVQNSNTLAAPALQTGSVIQGVGAAATAVRIELDAYAASGFFTAVRRDGTSASPTQVLAGDQIGGFNGMGLTNVAGNLTVSSPIASFRIYALENLTVANQGGIASIAAIPSGSTTLADQLTVYGSTGVGIGLASATTVPAAKLHVVSTTSPQHRVDYDGSNTSSWSVSSGGVLDIAATSDIRMAPAGTARWSFTGTALTDTDSSGGATLPGTNASSTAPTLVPNKGSTTTGIGAQASGNMSGIVGGAETTRWTSTGFQVISGKTLQLGNAATTGLVAGVLAATTNASIVILDSGGQAYRIPCII